MLYQGHAVAGIIGSSNFTKAAYGSYQNQNYNIEADTIIYKLKYSYKVEERKLLPEYFFDWMY